MSGICLWYLFRWRIRVWSFQFSGYTYTELQWYPLRIPSILWWKRMTYERILRACYFLRALWFFSCFKSKQIPNIIEYLWLFEGLFWLTIIFMVFVYVWLHSNWSQELPLLNLFFLNLSHYCVLIRNKCLHFKCVSMGRRKSLWILVYRFVENPAFNKFIFRNHRYGT